MIELIEIKDLKSRWKEDKGDDTELKGDVMLIHEINLFIREQIIWKKDWEHSGINTDWRSCGTYRIKGSYLSLSYYLQSLKAKQCKGGQRN